ncbi:AfsR/SARP family transcriptional regulator [Kutzneria sp. CA-103260]|uniref:AfsR/SARP family transcriptional regulator n=1 Tax=Kutzneria sp. CA-103260 TaxID=2802641 RepID=UPI001BAC52FA|nr:BTAD domain-containing putative transcriptional regulator [Kutzneria sp. CA-103260]
MTVRFRLLGEIRVLRDDQPVDIGHRRLRCLLAALLVDVGRVVPLDTLVDRMWREQAPGRPRDTLYTYMSRLRTVLAGIENVGLAQRSGGYVLTADADSVDLHRFRRLRAEATAAGDDATMADRLSRALAEWDGEPFAGTTSDWLDEQRTLLTTEHLAARLDFAEVRLRRGEHAGVLAALAALAAEHPLDERLSGLLMLALGRNGRQAEALREYDRIRRLLAEELGTDPGPALQQLHRQVLAGEIALPDQFPVPHQLPGVGRFVGRSALLAALDRPSTMVTVLHGPGGIGKTQLALEWAHRNAERHPDGQLFVDLRGFAAAGEPMAAQVAVRGFLDAFGVAPARIPVGFDAQVGLYRSLVAGRRLLIVLDNAVDTAQVAPLLPGTPTCTVLVTSRDRLPGLVTAHGARALAVDVLTAEESRELLTGRVGSAEPVAVQDLLSRCGGFPLALSIVAGRAEAQPDFPLAVLADELRESGLDALDDADPAASLPAVLARSYVALPPEQAKVFGLLGLAPGPDIGLAAAAALTGLPPARTRSVLRALQRVSLLHQDVPDRWRLHDLIALYAADQAGSDDVALRRLVDSCVRTACGGDHLLDPHRQPIEVEPLLLPDKDSALAWFTAEHACLLAALQLAVRRGWHLEVWRLAWALTTFHRRQGHLSVNLDCWLLALDAADQVGDPGLRQRTHRLLGRAFARVGSNARALFHLRQSLELAEDVPERAHSHIALARALARAGDDEQALSHATDALALYRELAAPAWEATALNEIGLISARVGKLDDARLACEAALLLHREQGNRDGEANTLDNLGRLGSDVAAVRHYEQALALYRELGNTHDEADTLDRLAERHLGLGDRARASARWREALALYQAQFRDADSDRVRRRLGSFGR